MSELVRDILEIGFGALYAIGVLFNLLYTRNHDVSWDQHLNSNAEELAGRMRDLGIQISRGFEGSHPQLPLYIGGTPVVSGALFLGETMNMPWLAWLQLDLLWAFGLIAAGVILLVRRPKGY